MRRCMLNLVTFEQLFDSFLGCLEMQVNYVKPDLVVNHTKIRIGAYVYKKTLFVFLLIFPILFNY